MAIQLPRNRHTTVIVGGGIAGLTAAAYLARAGQAVELYEQAREVGGRARTRDEAGYRFNFGPHALYNGGTGAPVLRDLGLSWTGGIPAVDGYGLLQGRLGRLPTGLRSIVTTRLLPAAAKAELVGLMTRLPRIDLEPLHTVAAQDWLDGELRHREVRLLLAMLIRVATYSADLERLSMGAALAQVRLALSANVTYLDDGWQTLVAGLRRIAGQAGATLVTASRVTAVLRDTLTGAASGVRLADGTTREADAVVVATSPRVVRTLVERSDETVLPTWDTAIPVQAACLDVALRTLPRPNTTVAFGLDRPLYLSVHSAVARLAPAGGAVIHVAKYLRHDEPADPRGNEQELLGFLDLAQPGWREQLVTRCYLPKMVVSNSLIRADWGGLAGRPGPAVPDVPGLYVAGDWVGQTGMLADAALTSARAAADAIVAAAAGQGMARLLTA